MKNVSLTLEIDSDGSITSKPRLEELKSLYYSHIEEIVNFPETIKGVSNDSSILLKLVPNNCTFIESAYLKAEDLFSEISKWIVLLILLNRIL